MQKEFLSKEKCFEIAKQCKTKKDLRELNLSVYTKAQKKGWFNEYTWLVGAPYEHTKIDYTPPIHLIYAYLDEENKVCYVGRTVDLKQRHSRHKNKKRLDTVGKYFYSICDTLPEPFILESSLTAEESQIQEEYWVNE